MLTLIIVNWRNVILCQFAAYLHGGEINVAENVGDSVVGSVAAGGYFYETVKRH